MLRNIGRPRTKKLETPEGMRARLLTAAPRLLAEYLLDPRQPFEIRVLIGREASFSVKYLDDNRPQIRAWREPWLCLEVTECQQGPGKYRNFDIPVAVKLDGVGAFLKFVKSRETEAAFYSASSRLEKLEELHPNFRRLAPAWTEIAQIQMDEFDTWLRFLRLKIEGEETNGSLRDLILPGMDTKFLERHRVITEKALAAVELLNEGDTYEERLGFKNIKTQEVWIKAHPDDILSPFSARRFAVLASEVRFPESVQQITIVENLSSFERFSPRQGVVMLFGSGNAISGIARLLTIRPDIEVVYWGDMDSFGMKILSRLRREIPDVQSVLMSTSDLAELPAEIQNNEIGDARYRGEIDLLDDGEQKLFDYICETDLRVEQEHIVPDERNMRRLGFLI